MAIIFIYVEHLTSACNKYYHATNFTFIKSRVKLFTGCSYTLRMQGRFEILSLSGSFLLSESGGQRSRTGGLSVSLAGPDGRVLGGVAGLLIAASPVQVCLFMIIKRAIPLINLSLNLIPELRI